ncbi:hypothetical protein U9M48_038132 [Paspalum notatum var. saurae]|uniref:Auxin efflux carrier component n=1 Tax=Paspalum notatum var. saurae TaxID=547442 RepID=A0AAQ3XBC5_PASNO
MIAWGDIYKVVAAMAPLYFALGLGYASVRRWRFFTREQCAAINTLVVHFSMPFFTFDFLARADPYAMNYRVLAADAVSKALAMATAAALARCCCGASNKAAGAWSITGFSLAGFNNTLVVGVPLLYAMYGQWAQDLIVQIAVVQSLVWFPILLLGFELRKACVGGGGGDAGGRVEPAVSSSPAAAAEKDVDADADPDVEMNAAAEVDAPAAAAAAAASGSGRRWGLSMPGIVTGSLQVMSKTGTGMSMFSMGLFMAQQEKVIACGAGLAALGMALRFVAGPLATLVGAAAFGLRGDVLRFAIIQSNNNTIIFMMQAALPQSIASFVFAKEYGIHADVLSTAVIFGTLVSLPVLIAYYAVLGIV